MTLSREDSIADLQRTARESGRSRFPVIGETIDDIVGVAHVKDSYGVKPERRATATVSEIVRPPLFVPESRDLASLLVEMRRDRQQLVVVVDEYGGTAGIITIEDLLEEIVGEIEDEYDPRESRLTQPPSGVHVVSGLMHGPELLETTGFQLPEGDFETLGGLLLSLFDRIPARGDHVSYEGWEFKIVEMDRNRIDRVLVVAPSAEPDEEPG